jgi:hypothetical protein
MLTPIALKRGGAMLEGIPKLDFKLIALFSFSLTFSFLKEKVKPAQRRA